MVPVALYGHRTVVAVLGMVFALHTTNHAIWCWNQHLNVARVPSRPVALCQTSETAYASFWILIMMHESHCVPHSTGCRFDPSKLAPKVSLFQKLVILSLRACVSKFQIVENKMGWKIGKCLKFNLHFQTGHVQKKLLGRFKSTCVYYFPQKWKASTRSCKTLLTAILCFLLQCLHHVDERKKEMSEISE